MRRIFARRITTASQCDPDTVAVPDDERFKFGDIIRYKLPNGNLRVGYYICECDEADVEPAVIVSIFKEMLL